MKRQILIIAMALFVGVILPGMIFSVAEKLYGYSDSTKHSEPAKSEVTTEPTEPHVSVIPERKDDSVLVLTEDSLIIEMHMDDYLTGVLLGELPANFEDETLKAQAIVARTYAKKRSLSTNKHPQGAVCTKASCCQAYCSPNEYLQNGGKEQTVDRFHNAVCATSGVVLTYQGELIEATYFSCSGGKTEDALAVWGSDVPYLQSVDSPGEENATRYTDQVEMSVREFASCLNIKLSGATKLIGDITYTAGGGVNTIVIGGQVYSGVELRQKLNLNSTVFTIIVVGDKVQINTKGFGHRVGMSQYGADAMAATGSDYQAILEHYYQGTILECYLD